MLFDRAHSTYTMTSIKKHIEYFNFKSKIQLDHSVTSVTFIALVTVTELLFPSNFPNSGS